MNLFTYDIEVFRYDWIVILKRTADGKYFVFHNDNVAVKRFMQDKTNLLVGFNEKHYDCHILKAICCGADNALIKEINDFIIKGNRQGFDHWFIKQNSFWFDHFDIKDDMQKGLSLKSIEGHLGLNIEETSVPFDIDRPLTQQELDMTIHYCKHDVDTTEKLVKIRKTYLKNKIAIGRLKGIQDTRSLYMTNAKLTAAYLGATKMTFTDERDYQYPDNLLRQYIPQEVFDFFDQLHDPSIPSIKMFGGKKPNGTKISGMKLVFSIGDCKCKIGFGGIHGAIPNYIEEANDNRTIRNKDVGSYYPHLVTIDGYCSRAMSNPQDYADMLDRRMTAKKAGDSKTANALKLVCNTTYGAMLNKYNDLYDPKMGRSVCITGQLRLLELANHLVAECPTLKVVQLNTDGIMISLDNSDVAKYQEICQEWQDRTGFELEEDFIQKIVQKDVNNYIELPTGALYDDKGDPTWKMKGSYFVYGIPKQGAFNINYNTTIVADSLVQYFVFGKPVEETITECTDLSKFQMIAKAGAKYKEAFQVVAGETIPIQKVNRVFSTKDDRYGTLNKVKVLSSDDSDDSDDEQTASAKIASLPEHCLIDNDNHMTIADIDKEFYINLALKRVNDFLGIKIKKPRKVGKSTMATTKKTAETQSTEGMTFLQKLFALQTFMDEYEWEKDGKNMHQQYKFISEKQYKQNFKAARRKAGLIWTCVCVGSEYIPAISDKMHMVKAQFIGKLTDPDSGDCQEFPFEGTGADNGDKALYKAYTGGLKFFLADQYLVAEGNDPEYDEEVDKSSDAPKQTAKPATQEERTEIKKDLTDKDGAASKLQINQLKKALKSLRETDPTQEDFIQQLAAKTENFTDISKKACEKLMLTIGEMIDSAGQESEDAE